MCYATCKNISNRNMRIIIRMFKITNKSTSNNMTIKTNNIIIQATSMGCVCREVFDENTEPPHARVSFVPLCVCGTGFSTACCACIVLSLLQIVAICRGAEAFLGTTASGKHNTTQPNKHNTMSTILSIACNTQMLAITTEQYT